MKSKFLFLVILIYGALSLSAQNTINVPGDQPTIQDGINAAVDGDIVLVDQGTYYENINFKGKAITVSSHFINTMDSSDLYNTIIDGSMFANPDSASVVYFINGEDTTSILSGFTIQGGKGTQDNQVRAGGGIMCHWSGPKIEHNRIVNNECTDEGGWASGGGIDLFNCPITIPIVRYNEISNNACYKVKVGEGKPYGGGINIENANNGYEILIEGNIIKNNLCSNVINNNNALGGGIYFDRIRAVIRDNQIYNNEIISTDTYNAHYGGGIHGWSVKEGCLITGNTFDSNYITSTWKRGGGLSIYENSGTVTVEGNTFLSNEARNGAALAIEYNKDVIVTNNIFRGNIAESFGGGIWVRDEYKKNDEIPKGGRNTSVLNHSEKDTGIPVIANNTFIENEAHIANRGLSIVLDKSATIIAFNNLFNNMEGSTGYEIYVSQSSSTAYLYNNLLDIENQIFSYGSWYGENNIHCEVIFEDDEYHLDSECNLVDRGVLELMINNISYYAPDTDMDGEIRPQQGEADIGADESPYDNPLVGVHAHTSEHMIPFSAYPNPVSDLVTFHYKLGQRQYTNLSIYDLQGRLIEKLTDQVQTAGEYKVMWNMEDLKAGLYLYRLVGDDEQLSGKILKK